MDGATEDDDGYLVTFTQDEHDGRSELTVSDARAVSAGPIPRGLVPKRVLIDFHRTWVDDTSIQSPAHSLGVRAASPA